MDNLEHSICTLVRQGALASDETLTAMGKILAQLPVDLSVGKVSHSFGSAHSESLIPEGSNGS